MNDTVREAILEELDAYVGIEVKQPNDITTQELAEHWAITDSAVKSRMRPAIESGKFVSLLVHDPDAGRLRRVYRKVEKDESCCIEYSEECGQ